MDAQSFEYLFSSQPERLASCPARPASCHTRPGWNVSGSSGSASWTSPALQILVSINRKKRSKTSVVDPHCFQCESGSILPHCGSGSWSAFAVPKLISRLVKGHKAHLCKKSKKYRFRNGKSLSSNVFFYTKFSNIIFYTNLESLSRSTHRDSSRVWMRSARGWIRSARVWMRSSRVWMSSSRVWMRSSRPSVD